MNNLSAIDKKVLGVNDLEVIHGKTVNQCKALDMLLDGLNTCLVGYAGTGKTFLALYSALRLCLDKNETVDRVVIVRSAVPVRDLGFLPGTVEEKMEVYEMPYVAICRELFGRATAWDKLKKQGVCSFIPSSYVQGLTLDNTIVIVDEFQNMTGSELDAIITRIGVNSQLVLCGDYIQSFIKDKRCLSIVGILESIGSPVITFTEQDIVRSGFVKDYIIARERLQ